MELHLTNADGTVNESFEAALASGLTSGSDLGRCFHRAIAADITTPVGNWATAEVERGTEPALIIVALMELTLQQVASLAGNFVDAKGQRAVLTHYHKMLDTQFLNHAERIAKMIAQASE